MKAHRYNRSGFTLIEVVAVLLLTALALVFGAMLLVTSTQLFISSKDAAEDSQKAQVAMNRLVKELSFARLGTVSTPDAQTVQWTSQHPDRFGEVEVATWDGSDLLLQGIPLMDNVGSFGVSIPEAGAVAVSLQSARSPGVTLTTIVHSRYDP